MWCIVYVYPNDRIWGLASYLVTITIEFTLATWFITYLLVAHHQTLVHTSILSVSGSIIHYMNTLILLKFWNWLHSHLYFTIISTVSVCCLYIMSTLLTNCTLMMWDDMQGHTCEWSLKMVPWNGVWSTIIVLEDATHFILSCTMLEAKRRELLSCVPPPPPCNLGIWTCLTPGEVCKVPIAESGLSLLHASNESQTHIIIWKLLSFDV